MKQCHNKKEDKSTETLWSICEPELMCGECRQMFDKADVKNYVQHLDKHRASPSFGKQLN